MINDKDILIGTGMSVELRDERKFTIVIYGDTNGDGKQNNQDLRLIADNLVKKNNLKDEYLLAGNLNKDNVVDVADLSIITELVKK